MGVLLWVFICIYLPGLLCRFDASRINVFRNCVLGLSDLLRWDYVVFRLYLGFRVVSILLLLGFTVGVECDVALVFPGFVCDFVWEACVGCLTDIACCAFAQLCGILGFESWFRYYWF